MRACQPKDLKRREWRSAWLGEVGEGGVGRDRERERGRECVGEEERGGQREKERTQTGEKERESELWLLLLYVSLPPGPPCANWAQPGVLSVLPEVFTLVLGPSFDLPYFLATAILDSFSLFYLPNSLEEGHLPTMIFSDLICSCKKDPPKVALFQLSSSNTYSNCGSRCLFCLQGLVAIQRQLQSSGAAHGSCSGS